MAAPVEEEQFSLTDVLEVFKSCLSENNEVIIDHYIEGWQGLVRFMNSLGNVFSFISKDAVNKIQIMVAHRAGDSGQHYATIQSMVQYELEHSLVDLTKRGDHHESGCRTILRLHRALRWLQLFLQSLGSSSPDSKTSALCAEAYNMSLAQFHPWIIRTAASMAFCTLPSRSTFFEVMNMGTEDEVVVVMLGEAIPFISQVYDVTQALYTKHNLLDLP